MSPKRHVPALYIGKRGLFPHEYIRIAWQMRDWKLETKGADSYIIRHENDSLILTEARMTSMICEWKQWEKNAEINGWNNGSRLKIIPRAFEIDDLKREKFDFAKIDIEGGEASLLKLDSIDFPVVLEAHGVELRKQLVQKFGLSILVKAIPLEDVWLLGNY